MGANLELARINLYQLYKMATSIASVCDKTSGKELETLLCVDPKVDDSEEEVEEDEDDQFEFDQTETDERPF